MPSPFDGKWRLTAVENGEAFYEAIKSPEDYRAKLRQLAEAVKANPNVYYEELKVDGNTLQRQAFVNGEKKRDIKDAALNTEIDHHLDDGRPAKLKLVKESENKIVRTQTAEGLNITSTFEVQGDTLTVRRQAPTQSVSLQTKFQHPFSHQSIPNANQQAPRIGPDGETQKRPDV